MQPLTPFRKPRSSAARRRLVRRTALLLPLAILATGCDVTKITRWGYPKPITQQGERSLTIWVGFFWVALFVGILVIGLILWACFRFRKRGDELPRQVHYNVPVEVIYTVLPFVIIAVLFYYTAKDEVYLDKLSKHPDLKVGVVGFQWSWQFNYPDEQLQVTGRPGNYPVLVLPAHKKVQFIETSPDVIHSFWVPEFLFKRDVVPGRTNRFEVTTEDTGTFEGRCTELCGVYHSRMLFQLKVVSDAEFQQWLQSAKAQAVAGTSDIYTTSATPTAPTGSAQ